MPATRQPRPATEATRALLSSPGLNTSTLLMVAGMGAGQLATAVIYLIAARSSTPGELGRVLSVVGIAITIGGVLDWGSTSNGLRELSGGLMSPNAYGRWMLGRALWFLLAGTLFAGAQVAAGVPVILGLGSGLLLATVPLPNSTTGPWRAEGKFLAVAVNTVTARSLSLLVMVTVAAVNSDAALLLPLVLWLSLALEAVIPVLWWPSSMRSPHGVTWWPWRGSSRLGLSNAAMSLQALDTPVIARSAGISVAGEYGAVARWTSPIGLIATSFSQSAFPRMAAADTTHEAATVLRRGLKWLLVAAGLSMAVAVASQPIVDHLLGPGYRESGPALATLAIAAIFGSINQGLYMLLVARRHDTAALGSMVVLALTQLTAAAVFAAALGAQGGALAALVAQVAASVTMSIVVWSLLFRERSSLRHG